VPPSSRVTARQSFALEDDREPRRASPLLTFASASAPGSTTASSHHSLLRAADLDDDQPAGRAAPTPARAVPAHAHDPGGITSGGTVDDVIVPATDSSSGRSRKRKRSSASGASPSSRRIRRVRATNTQLVDERQQHSEGAFDNGTMRIDPATSSSRTPPQKLPVNGLGSQMNGFGTGETNGFHDGEEGDAAHKRTFRGHSREEVTRLILQSLNDLGYKRAAEQLSRDSGYELELPSVSAFRDAVLCGAWDKAESLLLGSQAYQNENGASDNMPRRKRSSNSVSQTRNGRPRPGLTLAKGSDVTALKFLLRQQKYLELLEMRDLNTALVVLRSELTPLKKDVARLHFLSSLVMCPSAEDLRSQADWDGADGHSRAELLSEISRFISPLVMIPEHRLTTLFSAVQDEQILNCQFHNTPNVPSLYTDHECSMDDFPLETHIELDNHADEVWFLEFSHDGSMLATAGRDDLVCVYDTSSWQLKHEFRQHQRSAPSASSTANREASSEKRGVCYVAFSPNDRYLISCSQFNEFAVVDVREGRRVAYADHFDQIVTSAAWLPDSTSFVIGTQSSERPLSLYSLKPPGSTDDIETDDTIVLRNPEIHSWRDPPWDATLKDQPSSFRVTDCAINASGTSMAVTTIENHILVYSLDPAAAYQRLAEWPMEDKLTSINFSRDGEILLVNMNEGRVLALDVATGEVVCRYEGASQKHFVIRSTFGGASEAFVVSGSEDSRIYIWRRQTGVQVAALDAHHPGTVNSVAWNPANPAIFASAGDDTKVRIWLSAAEKRRIEGIPPRSLLGGVHSY